MLQSSAEGDYGEQNTKGHLAGAERQKDIPHKLSEVFAGVLQPRQRPPPRQRTVSSPPSGTYRGFESCDPIEAQSNGSTLAALNERKVDWTLRTDLWYRT